MTSLQARSALAPLGIALSLMLLMASTDALAGGRGHKGGKDQSGRVRIQNSRSNSEESTAERDRRLYRECRGRPNAGACAGYTQRPAGRSR
jgi:hypothetical protein